MPYIPGSVIETSRGVRRILNDGIARGLGVLKTWLGEVYPSGQLVRRTVALHVFEALVPLLTEQSMKTTDAPQHETPNHAFSSPDAASKQFSWKPRPYLLRWTGQKPVCRA
jgi:hypothetical protein